MFKASGKINPSTTELKITNAGDQIIELETPDGISITNVVVVDSMAVNNITGDSARVKGIDISFYHSFHSPLPHDVFRFD